MLLKEKIKLIRKELKLKQQDLSDTLSCGVGKIKQIESGATASMSYSDAKLLEAKYKISEEWLRQNKGGMFIEPIIEDSINENLISLPYVKDIRLILSTENLSKEYIKIPSDLFLDKKNALLEVSSFYGDSMQPTFFNGDLIIIDKNKKEFLDGKIFVLLYEDGLYIKRIFRMPQNKVILKSDNIHYPDIEVSKDDFRLLGQIIKVISFKNLL